MLLSLLAPQVAHAAAVLQVDQAPRAQLRAAQVVIQKGGPAMHERVDLITSMNLAPLAKHAWWSLIVSVFSS